MVHSRGMRHQGQRCRDRIWTKGEDAVLPALRRLDYNAARDIVAFLHCFHCAVFALDYRD